MATVAETIAELLEEDGVTRLFGVPSESFTPFMEAVYASSALEFVTTRHEGGAAFAAEAYAQVSGQIGVVMGGRAVGAANLAIGVHTARENSTPMLAIVGQAETAAIGREAFQEVDLAAFLGPAAKNVVEIERGVGARTQISRALRLTRSGRPGPVVMVIPEDVFFEEATGQSERAVSLPRPAAGPEALKEFSALLEHSHRPVVVAGMGVIRSDAREGLENFCRSHGIPVLAAWRRHDVVRNDSPVYAGHLQMGTHPEIIRTLKEADLVIALGARLNEITTQHYTALPADVPLAQVDIDADMLGKAYPTALEICADAGEFLSQVAAALEDSSRRRSEDWMVSRHDAWERVTSVGVSRDSGIDNAQIISDLCGALERDAILLNDAGNFAGWFHTYFRFLEPGTYVGAASGAMGYAVAAALGAQMAAPGRQVVSLAGDGGFMMTVQELATVAGYGLPVLYLVFNNNSYGSIRMHQEIRYPAHVIGSELHNPDFVQLAESFGVYGRRVESNEEFRQALPEALSQGGPALIEIPNDIERISVWRTIEDIHRSGVGK